MKNNILIKFSDHACGASVAVYYFGGADDTVSDGGYEK